MFQHFRKKNPRTNKTPVVAAARPIIRTQTWLAGRGETRNHSRHICPEHVGAAFEGSAIIDRRLGAPLLPRLLRGEGLWGREVGALLFQP